VVATFSAARRCIQPSTTAPRRVVAAPLEIAAMLLDAGANINAVNNNGQGSLHAAARMDLKDLVRFMGERGGLAGVPDSLCCARESIHGAKAGTAESTNLVMQVLMRATGRWLALA
jgi:ankyrin repeat protein